MKRGWLIVLIAVMFNLFLIMQASAEVTTSISGEYRLRAEYRDNADFDEDSADNQNFYGQRVRLGVDAKINPDLGGFIQLQDTRNWGTDAILTDTATSNQLVDIHQAYVTVKNIAGRPLSLKVGRQELNYGDQRLVGSLGWSNNGRAFDAVKLMYSHDIADIDFWTAKITENNACGGDAGCAATALGGNADTDFYGLYSTFKKNPIPDSNLQAYLLFKNGKDKIFEANGTTVHWARRSLKEYTLGGRLAGKVSGINVDYTGEVAYQTGEFTDTNAAYTADFGKWDISAYALAIDAGYMIPNVAWSPRVGIEYDYASGSSASDWTNQDYNAFDNLYPTNHDKYGYMDYQGWSNMQDIALKVSAKPSDKCWLYLAYHMFSLADKNDDWIQANGRLKLEGNVGKDDVGQEIDLLARHTFNQNLKVEAGVSQFMAGDFVKAATPGGTDDNSTWAYAMGTVSF